MELSVEVLRSCLLWSRAPFARRMASVTLCSGSRPALLDGAGSVYCDTGTAPKCGERAHRKCSSGIDGPDYLLWCFPHAVAQRCSGGESQQQGFVEKGGLPVSFQAAHPWRSGSAPVKLAPVAQGKSWAAASKVLRKLGRAVDEVWIHRRVLFGYLP